MTEMEKSYSSVSFSLKLHITLINRMGLTNQLKIVQANGNIYVS